MADRFFTQHWRGKHAETAKLREEGGVIISPSGLTRISVIGPYNQEFVMGARALSGRWRKRGGFWSFKVEAFPYVQALAIKVFGKELVTVKAIKTVKGREN